jgi:hypothetical protein
MYSSIRIAITAFFFLPATEAMSQELSADEKAQIILETTTAIKPQLPIQLDEYTTLYAVLAKTDRFVYVMNLSVGKGDVEEDIQQQLEPIFVQNMCGKESVRTKFLEVGINVEALYKFNDGAVAASFVVTKESCSQ